MTEADSDEPAYFEELARIARLEAAAAVEPMAAVRLKEVAVRHERTARRLRMIEQSWQSG
jgi:hypothetical protein